MKESRWDFPHAENLTIKGHNNSSIETFLDNISQSLTREIIQNSLDAKNDKDQEPVYVEFEEFSFPTSEIPDIETIREDALTKAKIMWEDYNETYQFLEDFEKVITRDEIPILRISDYHTTGLNQENFESLVEGDNFSTKNSIDSAGSKGIGKAAPFAASDLRMIFYNSNSINNGIKATGVINFVSFPHKLENKNDITQERGIFKTKDNNYTNEQITFGQKKRKSEEFGTDLFLIGLKDLGKWKEDIIRAILNNFLVSIYSNELRVSVYGELIDSNTLGEILKNFDTSKLLSAERNEFQATKNYYKVLTSGDSVIKNLPEEMVEKYNFIESEEDATLYLLELESTNRRILQTRKAGMKIYERGYINSIINFTGIFQATGKKFNQYLKDLENANHDKWSVDRKQGSERTEAKNLLRDLLHWFQKEIKENFGVTTKDINDAIGVNDLLPIQDTGEGERTEDSGIKNRFSDSEINKRKSRPSIADGDKEDEDTMKELIKIGIIEDEEGSSGDGSRMKGAGGGDSPGDFGVGEGEGKYKEDDTSDNQVVTSQRKKIGKANLRLKILGFGYRDGNYQLVGTANKNFDEITISFKSVGDSGSTYKENIISSNSKTHEITNTKTELRLKNIKKNDQININFKINNQLKLKMEAEMYEIKN